MRDNELELVVGIEVHVELDTESKMFCSCPTDFGAEPNSLCCPVCMGMPGSMPRVNERAIELAVRAGAVCHSDIRQVSRFDRKNYCYPDLPKAYQITQFEFPICEGGYVEAECEDGVFCVGLTRIHLEEDAGKLIHRGERTYIDYNRAGIPLIEIVSEPDLRSAEQAAAYLFALRRDMIFAGVSSCRMNEGKMRADVNLSVRRVGDKKLGQRTEIKNLNSFASVKRAIELEFERQKSIFLQGGNIEPLTLRYDEDADRIVAMRTKENESGYRFFREPDLTPVVLSRAEIEDIVRRIPTLARERIADYKKSYAIPQDDALLLTATREIADYFEAAARESVDARTTANLMIGEYLKIADASSPSDRLTPSQFAEISSMMSEGYINSTTAKKLVRTLTVVDGSPREYVEKNDLVQLCDREVITRLVREATDNNPRAVADFKRGKVNAKKAIAGEVMRMRGGCVEPIILSEAVDAVFSELCD